jgi:hypothetical protein
MITQTTYFVILYGSKFQVVDPYGFKKVYILKSTEI